MERLNQYRHLRREVEALEDEVRDLREKANQVISDTVTASGDFPYAKHTVVVRGQSVRGHVRLRQRVEKLERQRQRLENEQDAIEEFVDEIEDSQVRQIMRLRFLQGMSWRQTANRCGGGNAADGVRKKAERYLE